MGTEMKNEEDCRSERVSPLQTGILNRFYTREITRSMIQACEVESISPSLGYGFLKR
jgi:hypothetical protein